MSELLTAATRHQTCETCGEKLAECVGHFGFIDLVLPVFHIGCFKSTMNVCQVTPARSHRTSFPFCFFRGQLRRFTVTANPAYGTLFFNPVFAFCRPVHLQKMQSAIDSGRRYHQKHPQDATP